MRKLFKKLRQYEIRIRKAITTQMQGDYHSVFKGSGLEFDDVRAYQYGDDIRTIDWNVSAKGHGTFVKKFIEEKDQNIFFLLDVSASQEIGAIHNQKIDICKEIVGVLTLSAIRESSNVGLICFSDQKEKYVKPRKGMKHAYELITSLYNLKPKSTKTDLNSAIRSTLQIVKRKSVIILVSDFIDDNYIDSLRGLAEKHDLVAIQVRDEIETNFPKLGIVPLYDKELKKRIWVNTSSGKFKNKMEKVFLSGATGLEELCKKYGANYLPISTSEDFVPKLVKLFKVRNKSKKRG